MSEMIPTISGINYLIDGDIKWLMEQEKTLERDHILVIIKDYYKRITGMSYDEHTQENNEQ